MPVGVGGVGLAWNASTVGLLSRSIPMVGLGASALRGSPTNLGPRPPPPRSSPCRCLCRDCAAMLKESKVATCPMCREPIEAYIMRVF